LFTDGSSLFFFKWIDCEDEWERWQEKTKLGFGYKTQDIIRVEDGSWKM
jgi:hypothetical protein